MTLKNYTIVYLSLIALLALTLGVAYVDLGYLNTPLGLAIAALKALLVALFFMQLKLSSGMVRIVALAGVFWLGILITLTLTDFLSRTWIALP
jgi:cytochrome c oxidase subunit 4